MWLYHVGLPFNSLFSIFLGVFVICKNPNARTNQTWSLSCLFVAIWSLFLYFLIITQNHSYALLSAKICNVAAAYISTVLTHFCIAVTNAKNKKLLIVSYVSSVVITFFSFSNSFVYTRPISIFRYYTAPGPLFHYFTAHFFFYALYQEYLLIQGLKKCSIQKSNQIKYIILAITLGYIGGIFTFLPVYGIPINPLSSNFVWLYCAVISYAIIKHHLMDIKIIIRQSLVYSILIGLMTLVYYIFIYLTGLLVQNYFGYRSFVFNLVIFSIIALCFKPFERKTQELIDILIYKKTSGMLKIENEKLMEQVTKQDQMKSVATLAAGMAHEIKNPLTTIKTFAEYLPQKYDDPEFRNNFKKLVVDEVDRVNNIVKQLLEFSKPKELELKLERIVPILEETAALLSNNLLKNKIELTKDCGVDKTLSVDRNQLKQSFLNLFLNSIQAMPNGGKLTVKTSEIEGNFVITIADTGRGIPQEHLAHIFDPFYTTRQDGTGLGLSIVHGIIAKHGGKIEVQSGVGMGTTMSVILV